MAARGGDKKAEFLMHYILKIGEKVLVAFLMKKIIFTAAAYGSKSRSDGLYSDIPVRSLRVSPPREERESLLIQISPVLSIITQQQSKQRSLGENRYFFTVSKFEVFCIIVGFR